MKSPNDKARAERVVATLTRLRSVYDVDTVKLELETLARCDARHERSDQGSTSRRLPRHPNFAKRARNGFG
jgi:hypothetical protein